MLLFWKDTILDPFTSVVRQEEKAVQHEVVFMVLKHGSFNMILYFVMISKIQSDIKLILQLILFLGFLIIFQRTKKGNKKNKGTQAKPNIFSPVHFI